MIEVGNYLLKQTQPKLDVLEKFLAKVGLLDHNLKALTHQFKDEMLTCNVTTIEKTMSLQQLWESNSPFWTEKLNGKAVINVLRAFILSEQSKEEFDIESVCDKTMNSLNERLTSAISQAVAKIENEILNEEPKCQRTLTSLIY